MSLPVSVVIPVHKPEPDAFEKVSLQQCLSILKNYPITFVVPEHLDFEWYRQFTKERDHVYFEKFKWKGFREYSYLLVSPDFYQRFLKYSYILVYHLDAFIFKDQLDVWCNQSLDYAGSVVFNTDWPINPDNRSIFGWKKTPVYFANGGFSLRNTQSCYTNVKRYRPLINYLFNRREVFLEDIFWCYRLPQINPFFKLPVLKDALTFGIEYHQNYQKPLPEGVISTTLVPFGCHGWIQYHCEFWQPYIQTHGHSLPFVSGTRG